MLSLVNRPTENVSVGLYCCTSQNVNDLFMENGFLNRECPKAYLVHLVGEIMHIFLTRDEIAFFPTVDGSMYMVVC